MANSLTIRDVFTHFGIPMEQPSDLHVAPIESTYASPWYLRLFAGVGAWLASLMFLIFIGITGILKSEISLIVVGCLILVFALWIQRRHSPNEFVQQLALSGSLLGQAMIAVGFGNAFKSQLPAALVMIGLELFLLFAFDDPVHRFISTLVIVGALLVIIFEVLDAPNLIHGLIIGLGLLITGLSVWQPRLLLNKYWPMLKAVQYGVAVALLGVLLLTIPAELTVRWWWLSALGLFAMLLFAGGKILTELEIHLTPIQIAALLMLLLGFGIMSIKMPGLVGSLLVLVLGFWRKDALLVALAAAFGGVYLIAYYSTLELTLLQKSLVMLGTGVLLLGLRWMLFHFGRVDRILDDRGVDDR